MKNTVTELLISNLKRKGAPKQSAAEIDFIRTYYHRLSGQDFEVHRSVEFRNAALKHRKLGIRRKPGETIVALYNLFPSGSPHDTQEKTIINIILDDQPFVINSLLMKLNGLRKTPLQTLHPLFEVTRDKNHKAIAYQKFHPTSRPLDENTFIESYIQFVIDYTPEKEHQAIASTFKNVIAEINGVVTDWNPMRQQVLNHAEIVDAMKQGRAFAEYGELFRWMTQDHFAFLGYCELEVSGSAAHPSIRLNKASLLGTLKTAHANDAKSVMAILPNIVFTKTSPIVFTKTRQRANIHRPNYMDCILFDHGFDHGPENNLKNTGAKKKVSCFLGFLAGSTAALPTSDIPHLRNKTAHVLESSTLRKGGYAYKELRTILETLPREKIFQMDTKSLYSLCMTLLNQERRKTRLHLHKNICGHYYSCLVYVPRDLFNSQLRTRIQDFLGRQLEATEIEFDVYFSASILTRIHYTIHTNPESAISVDAGALEISVQEIARDWNDNLYEKLKLQFGRERASDILENFRDGFPAAYQQDCTIDNAVSDLQVFQNLAAGDIRASSTLSKRLGVDPGAYASFKLYCADKIALSDAIPILENMGVRILGGRPYKIKTAKGNLYRILEFEIIRQDDKKFDFEISARNFETTFIQCWNGAIENDGFNELTLLAGISWRRINLFRAYFRYLKQIRLRYSENYIIDALTKNPELVVAISNLFAARFDPRQLDARKKNTGARKINLQIKRLLNEVGTLDEERIIRALLDVMAATLRTNYFQPKQDNSPKSYISFKLDSRAIPRIPEPIPRFEIFVYSPRIEGVHLRGGLVARGGLRWSERPEDFRTEVLGLVKAQRVKNAVIVPVGSKGGFVAKQLPLGGADEILKEVIACYRIFISGLLDVTDNLSGSKIIPPQNVVRMDEDDPYLVVAADKGTATFSDIANEISENYGFWLGDAFASGGSAGYDHKKMGITARGAWESVKRHFRELGKDIQSEPFTVAGIGDMAGDVFGNGMLLSNQIQLVAAFNHKHIFLDPAPDVAVSYKERKRIFNLPRSSWTDYNPKLISKGGGIYSRDAKSITLSPQIKKALGVKQSSYAPNDLINVILKSEVELLWNGGIGTYVKSSSESHQDAQDRNNDSLRVSASELRCKVIGEGGNLGMTQMARIEFSQCGGLCYTDAIDNSAGVDTSDHEVNIKILLNAEMQAGRLSLNRRNAVLAKMEQEIGHLVLANNYLQTQMLSIETAHSCELMPQQSRAILQLEEKGLLNRELEYLPDHAVLSDRFEAGKYLTRPELAVLLSYSKMHLYQQLLDSDLPDNNYLKDEIENYFPALLSKKYLKRIHQHRLKREIISTQITNNLVGTMGATFHLRLAELTGNSVETITAAYLAARDILQVNDVIEKIQAQDNQADAALQMRCLTDITETLESAILWLIRHSSQPIDIRATVKRFSKGYQQLLINFERDFGKASPTATNDRSQQYFNRLKQNGLPESLARNLSARMAIVNALDIINIALNAKQSVALVAEVYFGIERMLELEWLRHQISNLPAKNNWHEKSKFSLASDLSSHQTDITCNIIAAKSKASARNRLDAWTQNNSPLIGNLEQMATHLKEEISPDFAMLSVLVSELSRLK
ncbi:NAD-glutamate dehydrogenase [Candidatus Spongiihabitans sp.]|uniref:NAD-glutamate dehydrogenase n=1 Tax=Candidatus Spongiihabitans sp. TaxID=3101308 RepID=UPI003C7D8D50